MQQRKRSTQQRSGNNDVTMAAINEALTAIGATCARIGNDVLLVGYEHGKLRDNYLLTIPRGGPGRPMAAPWLQSWGGPVSIVRDVAGAFRAIGFNAKQTAQPEVLASATAEAAPQRRRRGRQATTRTRQTRRLGRTKATEVAAEPTLMQPPNGRAAKVQAQA